VKNPQTSNRTLDETLDEMKELITKLKKLEFEIEEAVFDKKTGNYYILFQHPKVAKEIREKDKRPFFEKYSSLFYSSTTNWYLMSLTRDLPNNSKVLLSDIEVSFSIEHRGNYTNIRATAIVPNKEKVINIINGFYVDEITDSLVKSLESKLRSYEMSDRQQVNSLAKPSDRLYLFYDVRLV